MDRLMIAICKHAAALALGVIPPSVALGAESYGIAASDGSTACVAIRQPVLSYPRHVAIVVPGAPRRVLSATVTSQLKNPCAALASRDLDGSFFALRFTSADTLSSGDLGIAKFSSIQGRSFRSCTSNEGVHLTVWAGKALKSKRIWHEYVYLGYDLEPSCLRGETPEHDDGA